MRTVYDLLVAMSQVRPTIADHLRRERDTLAASGERLVIGQIDMTEDVIDNYESFRIPYALERVDALREGAGSLMVFAFLERALRSISEEIETDSAVLAKFLTADRKSAKDRSKIDGYLAFLESRELDFRLPGAWGRIRGNERKIRNLFAHGEWEAHYFEANSDDCFRTLHSFGMLLEHIEDGFVRRA
jgi:hypothetical protein